MKRIVSLLLLCCLLFSAALPCYAEENGTDNEILYQIGSTGPEISEIQEALQKLGYICDVDGSYGNQVFYAVCDLQNKNGITLTGCITEVELGLIFPDRTVNQTQGASPVTNTAGSGFEIFFLDVGEGDAAVVVCDGKAMIIDGGPPEKSDMMYSFLSQHNITYLDYVVCTHPDEDHIGGLSGALHFAAAGQVLCGVSSSTKDSFQNFLSALAVQGKSITVPEAGTQFQLGSAVVTVIGNKPEFDNASLMLKIQYGNTSFLFTGDAEADEETLMVNAWGDMLKSDVLKVGHHGSSTSSSPAFLQKVSPSYAVISVGGDNGYGHPTQETLQNLKAINTCLFRTDINGMITCTSNGSTVTMQAERNMLEDRFSYVGGYKNALRTLDAQVEQERQAAEAQRALSGDLLCPTPKSEPEETVVAQFGSQGQEVSTIQQCLILLGFLGGTPDGDFGSNTQNAVSAFQQSNGFEATGALTESQASLLGTQAAVKQAEIDAQVQAQAQKQTQSKQNTGASINIPSSNTSGANYIINKNSGKFHYPSCSDVKKMKESNKVPYTGSRNTLVAQGYSPCKHCNP